MKIAFIGMGIMGSRMAHNLLKNGYDLIIHNRTKKKAESLLKDGAEWAESPYEAGKKAAILFTMLSKPDVVEKTALGEKGFLSGMKKETLWVDCSTVNPSFSRKMSAGSRDKGIRFIDAPVSGTMQPAEKGELTFFVGGNEKDFEEIKPVLEKMGKKIIYLGKTGMGTSMKMVVNLMLGISMAAFSEAMALGNSLGFDNDTLFKTLLGGPVVAPYLMAKKEKFASGNYETEFPLQWMYKDLNLVSEIADEKKLTLPAVKTTKEEFAKAKEAGFGEKDFSALFKYLSSNGK